MKFNKISKLKMINEGTNTLKITVPKDIKDFNVLFKRAGFNLYLVGGAVRDAVLGIKPKDFDLATDAKPEQIKKVLKDYKFKEIGEAFGVVFVITPTDEFEIATFREDLSGGRRPDAVEFTTIDKDVLRRDLTINALFYDLDSEQIVDLVGGIEDLQTKRIRTVGNSLDRFGEDALRKLRAIRFAGRINGNLDSDIISALSEDNSLDGVSAPRIHDEFQSGIMKSKSTKHYLDLIEQFNFFEAIFPINGIEINKKFIESNNWNVQLAELLKFVNVNSIEKYMKTKLTYTEKEMNSVIFMHKLLNVNLEESLLDVLKLRDKRGVNLNDTLEFAKFNGLDSKIIKGIFSHQIITKGDDPKLNGLKGREIRDEIQRIEYERFKNN